MKKYFYNMIRNSKKILGIVFCLAITLAIPGCNNPFMERFLNPEIEDGSAAHPWRVYDEPALRKVGTNVDGWTLDAHYRQTANITLTGSSNWKPIGDNFNQFKGNYDGGRFFINGLEINANGDYQGLFGYISTEGRVKNVNLECSITVTGSSSYYIGGIAGANNGIVENCSVSGTIQDQVPFKELNMLAV